MKTVLFCFCALVGGFLCQLVKIDAVKAQTILIPSTPKPDPYFVMLYDKAQLPNEGQACNPTNDEPHIYPTLNGSEWSWRVRYCAHVYDKSFDWVDRGFGIGSDVILSPWSLPNEMPSRWKAK